MKKTLSLVITTVLLLSLFGCSGKTNSSGLSGRSENLPEQIGEGSGTMLTLESNFDSYIVQDVLSDVSKIVIKNGDEETSLTEDEVVKFVEELNNSFIMDTAPTESFTLKTIEVYTDDEVLFVLNGYDSDTLFVLTGNDDLTLHLGSEYIAKLLKS